MKTLTCLTIAASVLAACTSHSLTVTTGDDPSAKAEKNRITALKCEQNISNHDVDATLAYCAADFTDYGSGEDKPITNLDTLKAGLKAYVTAFPDLKGDNLNAFAHGDSVIVYGHWTGTFKSDYMGIKATGKSFNYNDAEIFTFDKDGKVTSHRSVQAMATFFAQLSIKPTG